MTQALPMPSDEFPSVRPARADAQKFGHADRREGGGDGSGEQSPAEQDRRLSEAFQRERSRLWSFIRRRIPDDGDAEDILQEVFYELIVAYRMLNPVERTAAWMFRVARNRITDWFRKKRPQPLGEGGGTSPGATAPSAGSPDSDAPSLLDLLPSRYAGPDAEYANQLLLDALTEAVAALPPAQRYVFIAHELDGRGFKELAEETGDSINTLLSRKRYAIKALRRRLETVYREINPAAEASEKAKAGDKQ